LVLPFWYRLIQVVLEKRPLNGCCCCCCCCTSLAGWFYHLTVVLVFTNSCINPFIYAAKYREFQHGVRRLVSTQNSVN